MTALESLHQLPVKEKLLVMEALWNDLSQSDEQIEVTSWQRDLLNAREDLIASGDAHFVDWEQAKKDIRAAVK
jgi:putative addiction module component (TIGR02574 family)